MFHKETVPFIINFDRKTFVTVNYKFGFTLVPKSLSADVYEFHFEDMLGKFEILKIGTDDKFSIEIPYNKESNTFKCSKGSSSGPVKLYLQAKIEMRNVHYVEVDVHIGVLAKDMELLDIYDYYTRAFTIEHAQFKYYIKKIAEDKIEIEIENTYGIRINGKTGNYLFTTNGRENVNLLLHIIYEKRQVTQDSEKIESRPSSTSPAARILPIEIIETFAPRLKVSYA